LNGETPVASKAEMRGICQSSQSNSLVYFR
jgi:hypothetical protein